MFNRHFQLRLRRGFTLIELLVVIAILGILASIVLMAVDQSRTKGRDGARKTQSQEILKALEIYYYDFGYYPADGDADPNQGALLDSIDITFYGSNKYINRPPSEDDSRYWYCADSGGQSMVLAVDTEQDKGGSEWCHIFRGAGPSYGCDAWVTANASTPCSTRFR